MAILSAMATPICAKCGKGTFRSDSGNSSAVSTWYCLVYCDGCGAVVGAFQRDMNSRSIDAILSSIRELARNLGKKLTSDPG